MIRILPDQLFPPIAPDLPTAPDDLARALTLLTADRDLWRGRYLAAHEVLTAVGELCEADGTFNQIGGERWHAAYQDVLDEFNAWRRFVERGIAPAWNVAVDPDAEPEPEPVDELEIPF